MRVEDEVLYPVMLGGFVWTWSWLLWMANYISAGIGISSFEWTITGVGSLSIGAAVAFLTYEYVKQDAKNLLIVKALTYALAFLTITMLVLSRMLP